MTAIIPRPFEISLSEGKYEISKDTVIYSSEEFIKEAKYLAESQSSEVRPVRMSDRPNIILILTDDQGPWAMSCAGTPELETPNLDRLAKTGMRFENFFCASPVCSPARASILTGRIPSQHGVHDWISAGNTTEKYEKERNGELIQYLDGQTGYTDVLAQGGYRCALSGKWHLGDAHHAQKSLEFLNVHAKGGGPYYNAPMIRDGEVYEEPNYVTDVITDNAIRYLERQKGSDSPFYLGVHYTAPHSPWSRENHPVVTYDRYFNECSFSSVPDGLEPPEWARRIAIRCKSPEHRRKMLSGYFAAITEMDRNVGRLLDWLEEKGLREDTVVFFMSDNGMNMGHHGVFGKGDATYPMNMFEESVKVPFIASHPGAIAQGVTNDELVSQYDFMPTLLDYVGLDNPSAAELPGVSCVGMLKGDSARGRDHVVVFDEYGPVRMVRTKEWKYVYRHDIGPEELYDLVNDPGETRNLAGSPEQSDIEREMRECLREWYARYADPDRDGARESVNGSGQIGLCGKYADCEEPFSQERIQNLRK